MISKYHQYYLDKLTELAEGGEVRITVAEMASRLFISKDYAKQVLYMLRAHGKLSILKEKGRIVGVRLADR